MKISCELDLTSSEHLELISKLLNVGKEDKKEGKNQNESEMKHPKEAICYSFAIDSTSPSYLKIKDKIFNVDFKEDVVYLPKRFTETVTEYFDSKNTASKKVAAEFGINGDLHMAFSGSTSMKISKNADKDIKTVRLDARCLSCIGIVSPIKEFNTFPQNKLNDTFKEAVGLLECKEDDKEAATSPAGQELKETPAGQEPPADQGPAKPPTGQAAKGKKVEKSLTFEEFASRVGIFYATDLHLGGSVRKSYIMQATKEDNEFSVKADIEAKFGAGSWGNGKASGSLTERTDEAESSMKTEWRVQGGDTTKLLGLISRSADDADANNLINEWAATVDQSNSWPISMTLKPIWDLVGAVAPEKGKQLGEYLIEKWKNADVEGNPVLFLSEQIFKDKVFRKKIDEKIQSHIAILEAEKKDAENWISTWHACFDIIRNWKWRSACNDGIDVMKEIEKKIQKAEEKESNNSTDLVEKKGKKIKKAKEEESNDGIDVMEKKDMNTKDAGQTEASEHVGLTAKDFKEWLTDTKKMKFDDKIRRNPLCGLLGRTYYQSNRINERNSLCMKEIILMCRYRGLSEKDELKKEEKQSK